MSKGFKYLFMISIALLITCNTATAADRTIVLEGVKNTRDLGGLKTTNGGTVRTGLLIRSGEIDHISASGKTKLDDMGVTAIIDLRTTKEATADPAEWPEGTGPRRYNFPLMENESDLIDEMRRKIKSGTAEPEWMDNSFHDAFGYIPTDYPASIRRVFDILLEQPEGESVLIHCSGGKDRTGVVSVLILTSLGVSREQIEADFLMSNVSYNADIKAVETAKKINAAKGTNMSPEAVWPSLGVRPEYLDYFYKTLNSEYGSIESYMEHTLGLLGAEIDSLRLKFLK